MDTKRVLGIVASLEQLANEPESSYGRGLPDNEIRSLQERLGVALPEQLQQWLSAVNGALVPPGGIFGVRPETPFIDIEARLGLFPEWKRLQWVPIAGDGCGNYYVVLCSPETKGPGGIVFVDTINGTSEPTYVASSSVLGFLESLILHELGQLDGWPFDETLVLERDPDMAHWPKEKLPWNA